jgi:hypothetical protein
MNEFHTCAVAGMVGDHRARDCRVIGGCGEEKLSRCGRVFLAISGSGKIQLWRITAYFRFGAYL